MSNIRLSSAEEYRFQAGCGLGPRWKADVVIPLNRIREREKNIVTVYARPHNFAAHLMKVSITEQTVAK